MLVKFKFTCKCSDAAYTYKVGTTSISYINLPVIYVYFCTNYFKIFLNYTFTALTLYWLKIKLTSSYNFFKRR